MTACPYCHHNEEGKLVQMDTAAPAAAEENRYYENDMQDLASEDSYVREQAVVRMAQRGFGVAQALISVLADLGKPGLAATAKVLGRIRDRRGIAPLANAARMGDEDLRTAALWALGQYKEPEVLPILLSEIEKQHPTIQGFLAFAAGGFHDARALPVLSKLSKHGNREVALQAVCALGELGDQGGVRSLRRALSHKDPVVRAAAVASIKRLGGSATRPVVWWGWAAAALSAGGALAAFFLYK